MVSVELGELVRAAAAEGAGAWEELVSRFAGLVWGIARGHGLGAADAADVSQTTWLRLAEHLDEIREPERVGGWLASTAHHESLHMLRRARRHVSIDDWRLPDEDCMTEVDVGLLKDERDAALWRAFDSLPPRCQTLLRLLIADPAPSYAEVSSALDMPVGSIGPSRSRCLDRLRKCTPLGVAERHRAQKAETREAPV